MCYANCPYEDRDGECMLRHDDEFPADAICMDTPEEPDEKPILDFERGLTHAKKIHFR